MILKKNWSQNQTLLRPPMPRVHTFTRTRHAALLCLLSVAGELLGAFKRACLLGWRRGARFGDVGNNRWLWIGLKGEPRAVSGVATWRRGGRAGSAAGAAPRCSPLKWPPPPSLSSGVSSPSRPLFSLHLSLLSSASAMPRMSAIVLHAPVAFLSDPPHARRIPPDPARSDRSSPAAPPQGRRQARRRGRRPSPSRSPTRPSPSRSPASPPCLFIFCSFVSSRGFRLPVASGAQRRLPSLPWPPQQNNTHKDHGPNTLKCRGVSAKTKRFLIPT